MAPGSLKITDIFNCRPYALRPHYPTVGRPYVERTDPQSPKTPSPFFITIRVHHLLPPPPEPLERQSLMKSCFPALLPLQRTSSEWLTYVGLSERTAEGTGPGGRRSRNLTLPLPSTQAGIAGSEITAGSAPRVETHTLRPLRPKASQAPDDHSAPFPACQWRSSKSVGTYVHGRGTSTPARPRDARADLTAPRNIHIHGRARACRHPPVSI